MLEKNGRRLLGRVIFCVAFGSGALPIGCSGSDPSGPCNQTVVMSCIGEYSCHEFYSQQAADAVRGDCIQLGQTISSQPCPHSFPDCCIETNGSYGNPEGICAESGAWNSGTNDCKSSGDTLCKR